MAGIKEKLEIIFGVTGADKFKREFEQADRTVAKSSRGITNALKGIGAAAVAYLSVQTARAVGSAAVELVKLGDNFRVVQRSSQRLAQSIGQDSTKILQAVKRGVGGAVSDLDLLRQVNQAILLGIPVTARQMETMAVTATRLGRAVGRDAASALGDLVTGIGRMSPLILDNLGITIKLEEAYKGLGENATDAQKKIAFFNAVMQKANDASATLGEQIPTVGERLAAVSARLSNLGTKIGDALSTPVNNLIDRIDALLLRMGTAADKANALAQGKNANPNPFAGLPGLELLYPTYDAASGAVGGIRRMLAPGQDKRFMDAIVGEAMQGGGATPRFGASSAGYKNAGLTRRSTPEELATVRMFQTLDQGLAPGDVMEPQLRDMTKNFKAEFKKIEKAGKDTLGQIPYHLQNDFQDVFANVGIGLNTLGLGSQGANVSRLGGFFRGNDGHDANSTMGKLSSTLGTLVPALGAFVGAVGIFKGLKSAFSVGSVALSDLPTETLQRFAQGDFGTNYYSEEDRANLQRYAKEELANPGGRSSGSNAFSVSTSISETQANSILAVLETQRAQDAERNNILTASLAVQNDMKFLMSINSGNLLTFQG